LKTVTGVLPFMPRPSSRSPVPAAPPNYWPNDASGALQSIPGYIASIDYEADGQTRKITYANGVYTQFGYSPTRRWLTGITTRTAAGGYITANTYTRDAKGRITAIDGLGASGPNDWSYTYDGLDQLTRAQNLGDASLTETFSYWPNGNMAARSRVAGAYIYPAATAARPHAPVTVGTKAYSYDANGNLVSDGSRALVWDGANRLSRVTMPGGAVTAFAYGPDG
jgi:uncharacterized protein RhaS with RHS repeats